MTRNTIITIVFFGNYFYGLCTVALSVEATLQQRFPLNNLYYFLVMFVATVLYYTRAYTGSSDTKSGNPRERWYALHRNGIRISQVILGLFAAISLLLFTMTYHKAIVAMHAGEWLLLLVFPFTGMLYYGSRNKVFRHVNLRHIGWLKPFVIGFAWAGMVNIYPILYYDITHGQHYEATTVGALLFLKNFMFITVLCIMFDIKDYASDYHSRLNTFIVKIGLRKTIFYIIVPLCLLGLGSFVLYGILHGFHPVKITLNVLPFLVLILVAYTLQKRRSIFYYLMVVDGLMLFKAVCGSIAMTWF